MDTSDAIVFALKAILGIGAAAVFASLCAATLLLVRGDSPILLHTGDHRELNWKQKAFLAAAAIGFLVCMFSGSEALLFWIPGDWGRVDEDGEFQTVRSGISALFAASAGMGLLVVLGGATETRTHLRILRKMLKLERKISESNTVNDLDRRKSELEQKLEELERNRPPRGTGLHGELVHPDELEIDALNDLLRLIERRRNSIRHEA